MQAAAGAGLPAVFAAWGYGRPEMADGAPVAMAVRDLPALLARIAGGWEPEAA
jgi:phosphoglycolate phosphatase